jgi:hypothetical protein
MNSRIIVLPFGIIAAFLLYQMFLQDNNEYSVWLFPVGAILVSYFIFRHQIEIWWQKKYPQKFDPKIDRALMAFLPPYSEMNETNRKTFQTRLDQFVKRKVFIGQSIPDVPDDIKYLISASGLLLHFHKEDWELKDYDRLVFYKHPFLTPNSPDDVHTLEVEHEDGVLIFSLEQLIPGLQDYKQYYNTALHAFAEIYIRHNPIVFKQDRDTIWKDIEAVGFVKKDKLSSYLGINEIDPIPVLIHYYVYYQDKFSKLMPDYYELLTSNIPMGR